MKKLTVSEIIKNEGIMLHKNKINLIIAPAGSGKTYYIFNTLLNQSEKSVYLCDTSNLRDMILKDKEIEEKVKGTDLDLSKATFDINKYNCTVMTYAKWFYEKDKSSYANIKTIICDEIHNLYRYSDKFDNEETQNYTEIIKDINMRAKNGVKVVGFTATHDRIKRELDEVFSKQIDSSNQIYSEDWNFINLSIRDDIKKLQEDFTFWFNNYRNLSYYLKAYNGFKWGKKAIIYTDRITECHDMVNICSEVKLNAIALWSPNNKKYPMNEEQHRVRESILTTGIIPSPYQVLIINGAYETGINILDEDVEIMICNSVQADTQIQSRSRIRKHIKALILKDKDCIDGLRITVPEEFLNRPLTTKDKNQLCKIVNVYGEKTKVLKWTSIRPIIENSGYEIKDGRIRVNKKQTRVSTITDVGSSKRTFE